MRIKAILLALSFFLIMSCVSDTSGNTSGNTSNVVNEPPYDVPAEFRGYWVYANSAEEIFLGATTDLELEYIDTNIITIKGKDIDDPDRHLVRAGSSNVTLHGNVEGMGGSSIQSRGFRPFFNIGGMDVILNNIRDQNVGGQTTTNPDGSFSIDGIPNGWYELIIGDIIMNVDLNDMNNDMGIITITDGNGCNLKSSVFLVRPFIFGDHTGRGGYVRITNVGNQDCLNMNFSISMSDPYLIYFMPNIPIGGNATITPIERSVDIIKPDEHIDVNFQLSFRHLEEDEAYRLVAFNIELRGEDSQVWSDMLWTKVYRNALWIHLRAQQGKFMRGHVVVPGQRAIPVSINDFNTIITLPEMKGQEYLLVLATHDITDETFYSMGVYAYANDPNRLTNNTQGSNNCSNTAIILNDGNIINGFLSRGKLQTFKISMSSESSNKPADLSLDAVLIGHSMSFFPVTSIGRGSTNFLTIGDRKSVV
jgi:hypothetical protein